jgi:signal transduction histidine kinase
MLAAVPAAARLAHAVRNYSTVISGYADLLLTEIADPVQREMIVEMRAAADEAAQTSALHLRCPSRVARSPVEVDEYLRSTVGRVSALAGAKVRTTLRCDVADVFVVLIRSELDQVLLNLVRNAIDALRDGGELSIAASLAEAPHAGASATFCRITVADTGPGVEPDLAERIFDPFFTTKTGGTGIGLAEVRYIVSASGGFVALGSPPCGAEFSVYLPIARNPEDASFGAETHRRPPGPKRPDAATPLPEMTQNV